MVDSINNIGQVQNATQGSKPAKQSDKADKRDEARNVQDEVSISARAADLLNESQANEASEDVRDVLRQQREESLSSNSQATEELI